MASSRESLSAQSKRRTNRLFLVFGLVLAMLFLLVWCRMQPEKKQQVIQRQPDTWIVPSMDPDEPDEATLPSLSSRGDGQLVVTPSEVVMTPNVVIGSEAEAPIILRAENAPILLINMALAEEQKDGFVLSGSCTEKERLIKDEECTVTVSWRPQSLRNIQNTLVIQWREDSPSTFKNERTNISLKAQSTDSKDCVICCEEKEKGKERTAEGIGVDGKPIDPNDPNLVKREDGILVDKETGKVKGFTRPEMWPLNMKNELMGEIAKNGDVIDANGKVVGRLLGDDTIVDLTKNTVLGKAIPKTSVMNEHGHVFGKMEANGNVVSAVDAKGKVLGFPRVDGQVVDENNNAIGFVSPWGGVIDSVGKYIGLMLPTGSVIDENEKEIATMRPMGFAINKRGELVGGAVPQGIGIGVNGALGKVGLNGEVKDSLNQTVGRVLLDRSIVDEQMNEKGSVVREGIIINESGKPIGYINSEGQVLNFKAEKMGVVYPDGMAFAGKKFVGTVMPEGQITQGGCSHVGSVYPDGSVVDITVKKIGYITPEGKAFDDKKKELGVVVPWGTAIAEGCRLLGLISLNGDVVSTDGVKTGCVNPDKTVQSLQGQIAGEVTPLGLYVNAQNQVIGRVRLDGQIMDNKGMLVGCIYEKKAGVLGASTKGVIVDENGYPFGGTSVGNKAYDEKGGWIGDVYFNGWVIGEKGQLKGTVPFTGTIFSDSGKIVGHYSQLTGILKDTSGANLGRVLPGLSVINPTGTEILGKLIPEGTIFLKLDGSFLGRLNAGGALIGPDAAIYTIHANGTVTDKDGKLVGARVPEGPVLSGNGKYVGWANNRGEVVDNRQIKIGRVLSNGLTISDKNQVLGEVFPVPSVAVSTRGFMGSVEPKMSGISGDLAYQLQVNDTKGNFVGNVSGTGVILGLDNAVSGRLIPVAPFVDEQGKLLGWTNFQGEVNAPDGRSIANILPSGQALSMSQNLLGSVVESNVVVDPLGAYLGHIGTHGEVLSQKGEKLATVNGGRFLYNSDGTIIGQILKPGIAVDVNDQLLGWTRFDGQIENGTKVLGSVGLDGHVFDVNGQMIGRYIPLGMTSFNDAGKSVGFVNDLGDITDASGLNVTKVGHEPYVVSKGTIIGREKSASPFVTSLESGKILGIVSEDATVIAMGSDKNVGSVMMNATYVDASNKLIGGMSPMGLAIMPTLGLIGSVAQDGQIYKAGKKVASTTGTGLVYSETGELIGGIYTPSVLIDKRGVFSGMTSGTSAVFKAGVQIGNKLAFNSALSTDNKWLGNTMPTGGIVDDIAQYYGVIMTTDGTVVGNKNEFAGRVLADGSVAGVPEKAVFNTMPYAGHTIQQGIPVGINQGFKVVGKTTVMGDVVDNSGKKLYRIIDNAYVVNKSGQKPPVLARVFPIISAVSNTGEVMGVASSDGTVISYQGEVSGRVDNAGFVRLNEPSSKIDELRIQGRLVPEGLVVNNCKVVGQTAYDGRVINGQGSVVGRIRKDLWAIDANGAEIGRVARNNEPCIKGTQLVGRTLPDSMVVDLNGVEIGCATNSGEMLGPSGEVLCKVVERGVIIGEDGEIKGWTRWNGQVYDGTDNIGLIDENGNAYDWNNNLIGRNFGGDTTIFTDEGGKVTYVQKGTDEVQNTKGEPLYVVPPVGEPLDPWGNPLGCGLNPYIPGKGCLQGCDLIGYDGQRVASLMADGTFRDENGDLVYKVAPDGQVFEANGNQIENLRGVDVETALKQCGMSGASRASSGRQIAVGNRILTVGSDGTLVDEEGMIIGYLGEDGRPYTFGNKPLTGSDVEGRERPNLPEPFKPSAEQSEDFQTKLMKRRQGMKAEMGKGILTISAEMEARAKPKKDKDWSEKLGVPKSISTWPVDMSHVVLQGKAIPAVLARSIDSRYQTPAIAIVETNIYGEEGRNILIPAGSRLIGTFSGEGGENRVSKMQISWERLIRPDGSAFNLSGAQSGDAQGRGGVAAYLDEQLWSKYGTSIMSTLASSAVSYMLATNDELQSSGSGSYSGSGRAVALAEGRQQFIEKIGDILDDIIEKSKDKPPVVFIPAGTRLTVFPSQDLWLRSPDDDAEDVKNNPPREEDRSGYRAQLPDMDSWTQKRQKERLERDVPAPSQPEGPKETETPLYDGEEQMPDISERKVEPVALDEEPLF